MPIEDLPGAIALGSAQWNLGRVIGPLLAGIAISLGGVPWAFGANTVSFFAVIVVLLLITLPRPSADARAGEDRRRDPQRRSRSCAPIPGCASSSRR